MSISPFYEAIQQAQLAVGRTHPNPPVGAVVVKNGEIVGRGFTSPAGGPHAEVHALRQAGDLAKGSTLYVTLEPCSHFGRTPPCVDAVIQAGVSRVVVGMQDPNPQVNGSGIQKLCDAGIDVEIRENDELTQYATALLKPFVKSVTQKMPFVLAKVATSLDGHMTREVGTRTPISGPVSQELLHQLRHRVDAVMVGANTVMIDDPQLNVRLIEGGRDPARIVIDGSLRTNPQAKVYAPGVRRIVFHTCDDGTEPFREQGVETILVSRHEGHTSVREVFSKLGEMGFTSVLVECGPTLFARLMREELVDELWWISSPKIFGVDMAHEYEWASPMTLGGDTLFVGTKRSET